MCDKHSFFNPLYNSSWFATESNLTLDLYIKYLFDVASKNLKCNVETNSTKAILVPVADIKYSGLCAASAYCELLNRTHTIKNIILLCTNNKVSSNTIIGTTYKYIASYKDNKNLILDTHTITELLPYIEIDNQAFNNEYSFFNQLPFIEYVAPDALICPLIIGNLDKNSDNVLNILESLARKPDTIIICASNLSYINGHFQNKITSFIPQNIKNIDNNILDFIYNIVNGVKTRTSKIDELLFMKTAPTTGIMNIYVFSKLLSKIGIQTSRISSYYTSQTRDLINIFCFNKMSLVPILLDGKYNNPDNCSVSYIGLIFTTKQYNSNIDLICSDYEKIALLGFARELLFYKLYDYNIPDNIIHIINSPVFNMNINLFITLHNQDNLYVNIGTLDTPDIDTTLESNIKQYILNTPNLINTDFARNFDTLEISITLLNSLKPISLNDYFGNKFNLGHDGLLISYNNKEGFYLPNIAKYFKYNKQALLEQLCINKLGTNIKECFNRKNTPKLFYNKGMEIIAS